MATPRQLAPVPSLTPVRLGPVSLADRLKALRLELAALEQQQQAALRAAIALVVGHRCFSARELWAHRLVSPALASAFDDLQIRNPRQLGKKLKQIGLTREGVDEHGAIWSLG